MEIEGVYIAPLVGWEAFFIGFIIVLIAVRLGAELIVYFYERKARKTRQRYYNTYRKGA